MFQAVYKLGLEGIVSKKLKRRIARAIENLHKSQKSEGTRCHPRYRWGVFNSALAVAAAPKSMCAMWRP